MRNDAGQSDLADARPGRAGPVLIVASLAALVAGGLLLWRRNGEAVFGDMVLAAIAWCI